MSSLPQSPDAPSFLLRQELGRRAQRNPAYSLRAFARDLGVSHTYLSLVMNGKKSLSLRRAYQMAEVMGLPSDQVDAFVAPSAAAKREPKKPALSARQLANDQFQLVGSWYHIAILELTELKDFRSDVTWIAGRLGITPKQAGLALTRLERLGLLTQQDGVWRKVSEETRVPGGVPVAAIRRFHGQMIRKALGALKSSKPEAVARRDVTGTTIPIDPAKLPEAKKRIARFRRQLMRFLSGGDRTALYQLNVQLFELGGAG